MGLLIVGLALSPSDAVSQATTQTSVTWTGQGENVTCELGGEWHWILSYSSNNTTVTAATLYVTFSESGPTSATASQLSGAVHFYVDGVGSVESAYADVSYTGEGDFNNLVISHVTCDTTTTTAAPTTTTVAPTTTTTSVDETTTTAAPTTTTEAPTTTTSVLAETTSTEAPTTSTTLEQSAGTSTTVAPTTTTTVAPTTSTTQAAAAVTTTLRSSVQYPTRVDAGGGGLAVAGEDGLAEWRQFLLVVAGLFAILALLIWSPSGLQAVKRRRD